MSACASMYVISLFSDITLGAWLVKLGACVSNEYCFPLADLFVVNVLASTASFCSKASGHLLVCSILHCMGINCDVCFVA